MNTDPVSEGDGLIEACGSRDHPRVVRFGSREVPRISRFERLTYLKPPVSPEDPYLAPLPRPGTGGEWGICIDEKKDSCVQAGKE